MRRLRLISLLLCLALIIMSLASCSDTAKEEADNNGGDSTVNNGDSDAPECEHMWLLGSCLLCAAPCEHEWSSGACVKCGNICSLEYNEGNCPVCGYAHPTVNEEERTLHVELYCFDADGNATGSYSADIDKGSALSVPIGIAFGLDVVDMNRNGYFVINGERFESVFDFGTLEHDVIIEYHANGDSGDSGDNGDNSDCSHLYDSDDGLCYYCGAPCPHANWVGGQCMDCWKECEHPGYNEGICIVCAYKCRHYEWQPGRCKTCGIDCKHNWINGICYTCKLECEHPSWLDDVCDVCHLRCYHTDYLNAECTLCGKLCEHTGTWINGKCLFCDYECLHSEWNDRGNCKNCNYACRHNEWSDGYCVTCRYRCVHTWRSGVCSYCGIVCNHDTFLSGSCNNCFISCEDVEGTITVSYNGVEYTVSISITLSEFITSTLGLDFDAMSSEGYWYVESDGNTVYLSGNKHLCDLGKYVPLRYVAY